MKPLHVLALLVLPLLIGMTASAVTSLDAATRSGLERGVVFKVPLETDEGKISYIAPNRDVRGGEILLMWGDVEKQEGVYDWSRVDEAIAGFRKEGKRTAISVLAAAFSINDTPAWVFNDYGVRRIAKGHWNSFEGPDDAYVAQGAVVSDAGLVLAGSKSLKGSASGASRTVLRTVPGLDLSSGNGHSIQFDYRIVADATYAVTVTRTRGGETSVVKRVEWTGKAGDRGSRTVEFVPDVAADAFQVAFSISDGTYVIDNVNIVEMRTAFYTGTLTFPNYFDPVFREKYARFVEAFAAKYKEDPDVAAVYVGGFGRWEELTLCDDQDLFALEDQWTAFGYTDAAYLDHVAWCADTYLAAFGDKPLMMTIAGFPGADAWRDMNLLNWKVQNLAASRGIALKYNGWQAKCTDWNGTFNQFAYAAVRYRDDPEVWYILEEGAQVNGELSEIMGHPVSLLNKALALGADHYWIYPNDITDPFTARYLQYANEQAGTGLFTAFYNILGRTLYDSPHAKRTFRLDDVAMELYHPHDAPGVRNDYVTIDGVQAARTNADNATLVFSLDDCQKWSGMYGSVLTVDYLDEGTDTFEVSVLRPDGQAALGTVTKTGTGRWKSVSFADSTWTNAGKAGKADAMRELWISDNGDGLETVRKVEVHFVPARRWKESVLAEKAPADLKAGSSSALAVTTGRIALTIPADAARGASAISLPVGEHPDSRYGYVNLRATVTATVGGAAVEVARKDLFMPGEADWFDIPVAFVPDADAYTVELSCDQGKGLWFTDADGKPAYRLLSYAASEAEPQKPAEGAFIATWPFSGLRLSGSGLDGRSARIERRLPDGSWAVVDAAAAVLSDGGRPTVRFEPQTAGTYRISVEGASVESVVPLGLVRIQDAKAPLRDLRGQPEAGFGDGETDGLWTVVSGLSGAVVRDGVLTAAVASEEPVLETARPLAIEASRDHQLHFILKNGTGSGFVKVYWKRPGGAYAEADSFLVPVVANDTEYREYSFHIGYERNWSGTIEGLRFLPVTGHTDAGLLSLRSVGIRKGLKRMNAYLEPLDVAALGPGGMTGAAPTGPADASPTPEPDGDGKAGGVIGWIAMVLAAVAAAVGSFLFGARLAARRKKA